MAATINAPVSDDQIPETLGILSEALLYHVDASSIDAVVECMYDCFRRDVDAQAAQMYRSGGLDVLLALLQQGHRHRDSCVMLLECWRARSNDCTPEWRTAASFAVERAAPHCVKLRERIGRFLAELSAIRRQELRDVKWARCS